MTNSSKEEAFLKNYDIEKYEKPSVTVDVVAFTVTDEEEKNYRKLSEKKLKILLTKREHYPFKNKWALPGGFVGLKESLPEATGRILLHKADLKKAYLEQLYTWGETDRDPRHRIFSISYLTLIQAEHLKSKEKKQNPTWFTLTMDTVKEETETLPDGKRFRSTECLTFTGKDESFRVAVEMEKIIQNKIVSYTYRIKDNEHLAFDHAKIIAYGLKRLREKIDYTPIAFSLMPDLFTLTELQKVYETILNKELLKANFRRKIAPLVTETDAYKKDAGHRPSRLYKFNNNFQ